MNIFASIKKSILGIAETRSQKQADLIAAKARQHYLNTAPLPAADQIDKVNRSIDMAAAVAIEGFSPALFNHISDPSTTANAKAFPLLSLAGNGVRPGINPNIVYYILNDQVKAAAQKLILAANANVECGPPLAERGPELERLAKDITRLEAELAEIDREAAAAGITFSPPAEGE